MNYQSPASDAFPSGAFAVGWAAVTGLAESGFSAGPPYYAQPVATGSTTYGQQWTGTTWPNDQGSEVTLQTLTAEVGTVLTLLVRMQPGANSGYACVLTNNTAAFWVVVAGVLTTQIGSTLSGLTFAAGNILSFRVDGVLLTFYQNSAQRLFCADPNATYASGSPGFSQSSTVNVAHCQVAAWRGYNAIQQAGIWEHQGSLFSPLASMLGGASQGVQNPAILYETGPVVLADTGAPVYKMWYAAAQGGTPYSLFYAESYNAKPGTWVQYSASPILAAGFSIGIWKNAGTYYLFAQTDAAHIKLWTSSTNGVTGLVSVGVVLSVGAGGAWDNTSVFVPVPIQWDGTTLTIAYSGQGAAAVSTGLATTTLPITTSSFVKGGANPVVTNCWGLGPPYVDGGGVYHFWALATNPGRGSGLPIYDPASGIRVTSSPPFASWSTKSPSFQPTQPCGGLNNVNGGEWPVVVWGVGNKTYAITETWPYDNVNITPGEVYHFNLSIANVPIATLVTGREDGCLEVASDTFSGSGNLSGNWSLITGINRLTSPSAGVCQPSTANVNCAQAYTGAAGISLTDHYSEVTILTAFDANQFIIPAVRMSLGALTFYGSNVRGAINSAFTATIGRTINGSTTTLLVASATGQVGDVWRLSAVGSNPVLLTLTQNDFVVGQVQDFSASALTTGYPGLDFFENGAARTQISKWAGGNAGLVPAATGKVRRVNWDAGFGQLMEAGYIG